MEDFLSSETGPDLIALKRCRDLLGDEADGLSEEEVDLVRRQVNGLAHVLIDICLSNSSRR